MVPVRLGLCEEAAGGTATSSGFSETSTIDHRVRVMNGAAVKTLSSERLPGQWRTCRFPLGSASQVKLRVQMKDRSETEKK